MKWGINRSEMEVKMRYRINKRTGDKISEIGLGSLVCLPIHHL